MTDELKRQLMNDLLLRVGVNSIGKITIEENNTILVGQEWRTQMPPHLTHEQGMELYRYLTAEGFIEATTSSEFFLYLMGVTMTLPAKLKSINWLQTVQQLRVMLESTFQEPIERKAIKLADIERRAVDCFLVKGKKIDNLANYKEENSLMMDKLMDFFRPK